MGSTLFTRTAFLDELARARDLYADLHTVEAQLAWLRAQTGAAETGFSVDLPGNRDVGVGGIGTTTFRFTLGTTHPFDVTVMQAANPLDWIAQTAGVRDDLWDKAMAAFGDLERAGAAAAGEQHARWLRAVDRHLGATERDFVPVLDDLASVHQRLTLELDPHDVAQLGPSRRHWHGGAADAFRTYFYDGYDQVRSNQCHLLKTCYELYEAVMRLNASTQGALMNAVVAGTDALDDQLRKRAADDRAPSTSESLALLAAWAGAAAAVTVEFPPAAVAFGTVAGVAGATALLVQDEDTQTIEVAGASADELAASLHRALTHNVAEHRRRDDALADLSRELRSIAASLDTESHLLVSPRPFVGVGVTPRSFHHSSSPLPG